MTRRTLKEAREFRGWTQQELEKRSGVFQTNISAIERGKVTQPERKTMDKLSDALNMDALCGTFGLVFEERQERQS